jgi:hypothetical protein
MTDLERLNDLIIDYNWHFGLKLYYGIDWGKYEIDQTKFKEQYLGQWIMDLSIEDGLKFGHNYVNTD